MLHHKMHIHGLWNNRSRNFCELLYILNITEKSKFILQLWGTYQLCSFILFPLLNTLFAPDLLSGAVL